MIFKLSKLNNLIKNEDAIFNLFIQYNITDENSVEFVKKYLNGKKAEFSPGTTFSKVVDPLIIPVLIEKLEEKTDFFRRNEQIVDKDLLKKLLTDNNNISTFLDDFSKMEKNIEEIIYITPHGIVKLMEDDYKELVKPMFYNILLLCLTELKDKDKKK
jgi:hypothetical protein